MARRKYKKIPVPSAYTDETWGAVKAGQAAYRRALKAGREPTIDEKAANAEYERGRRLADPQALLGQLCQSARNRAAGEIRNGKRRRRPCPLDNAALPASIPSHCPLTGLPISLAKPRAGKSGGPRRPAFDRIIPEYGYAFAPDGTSNVRCTSKWGNTARARLTDDEFAGFCMAVVITAQKRGWMLDCLPIRLRHAILQLLEARPT